MGKIFAFIFLFPALLSAEEPEPGYSPICTGYDSTQKSWSGVVDTRNSPGGVCPANSVLLAHGFVSDFYLSDISKVPIWGSCCPLPPGALLEEHEFAAGSCSENHVVTGAKREKNGGAERHLLRCTKINGSILRLGVRQAGWIIGPADDPLRELGTKPWTTGVRRTARGRIPVAIRYGILRQSQFAWDEAGCVGHPWGSVLTGRRYANCGGLEFQELQLRVPSGGPSGSISALSPCRALDDPYSPQPICVEGE